MNNLQAALDFFDKLNASDLSDNPGVALKYSLKRYLTDVFEPEDAIEIVKYISVNFGPQDSMQNPMMKQFVDDLAERLGTFVIKLHNEYVDDFGWEFFLYQVRSISLDLS